MPLLGAHQSIAGGYHKAVEIGVATGCQVIQVFTKNTNQWRGKPITPEEAKKFREATAASGIACPLAHDSYLINLASPEKALWKKSIDALVDEVQRAALLGISWVVCHPGAFTTTSEAEGIKRIITALEEVLSQSIRHTPCAVRHLDDPSRRWHGTRSVPAALTGILLETTAGQGTTLGWRFEHLAAILAGVKDNRRLGVCFDTCHVFAAGYKISTRSDYRATMKQFDKIIGLDQIRAFHLNDSVKDCGSRVDRHAHIGCGKIGSRHLAGYFATAASATCRWSWRRPRASENGEDLDVVNLRKLHELATVRR